MASAGLIPVAIGRSMGWEMQAGLFATAKLVWSILDTHCVTYGRYYIPYCLIKMLEMHPRGSL